MENKEETRQEKTIDIYPCKRSRRILTFLGDFFLTFITAVFLFEIIIRPIAFEIIDALAIAKNSDQHQLNNIKILYDNELLYFDRNVSNPDYDLKEEHKLDEAIRISCDVYTADIIKNPGSQTYDVFTRYLVDFKGKSIDDVLDIYEEKATKYFDVNRDTKQVFLKDEYVTLFAPKFNDKDEISPTGQNKYSSYIEEFYLSFYADVILSDIKVNNITCVYHPEYGNYIDNSKVVQAANEKLMTVGQISAFVAFFVSTAIYYFIVPLTNEKGRTVFEMILKVERVDIKTFKYVKKRFIVSEGLINMLENTPMLYFVPIISYQFGPQALMVQLIIVGLIGLLFVIIQFFIMMFTKFNRSIKEYATHTICVDTETMDTYYREQGYDF